MKLGKTIEEVKQDNIRREVQKMHDKFIVKLQDDDLEKPPSRYYIVDAFGHLVFVRVRSRSKAQEIVDEVYGKGFYKIRYMGLEANKENISAR